MTGAEVYAAGAEWSRQGQGVVGLHGKQILCTNVVAAPNAASPRSQNKAKGERGAQERQTKYKEMKSKAEHGRDGMWGWDSRKRKMRQSKYGV